MHTTTVAGRGPRHAGRRDGAGVWGFAQEKDKEEEAPHCALSYRIKKTADQPPFEPPTTPFRITRQPGSRYENCCALVRVTQCIHDIHNTPSDDELC